MKIEVDLHAVKDLSEVVDYYEDVEAGLGARFVEELDEVLARLGAFPFSAPETDYSPRVRRAPLRKFPYGVFYEIREGVLVVLRIIHSSRSSERWPR